MDAPLVEPDDRIGIAAMVDERRKRLYAEPEAVVKRGSQIEAIDFKLNSAAQLVGFVTSVRGQKAGAYLSKIIYN